MNNSNGGSRGRQRPATALVIVSHQSLTRKTNPAVERIRRRIRAYRRFKKVFATNIASKNSLERIAGVLSEAGIRRMEVFPYFLHDGFHVQVELPARIRAIRRKFPDLAVRQCPHLGSHPELIDIVAELIGPAARRPKPISIF